MTSLKTAQKKYDTVLSQIGDMQTQTDEVRQLVETKEADMRTIMLNGGNFKKLTDELMKLQQKHSIMIEHLSLAEKHQDAAALVLSKIVDKNAQKVAREEYRKAAAVISDINRQIGILATKDKDLANLEETIGQQRSLLLDNSGAPFYGWINAIQAARYRLDKSRQWWEVIVDKAEKLHA